MRGRAWSDEEKARAVAIVAEQGLAAAWRETGIPKTTIVVWCKEAGVARANPERTKAALDALNERQHVLRAHLRHELLERALDILERIDSPHIEFKGKDAAQVTYPVAPAAAVQNYATSAAILLDKYRLEVGEATGRTESLTVTDGLSPEAKRALRERLARSVRGESDAGGTDQPAAGVGAGLGGDQKAEAEPATG